MFCAAVVYPLLYEAVVKLAASTLYAMTLTMYQTIWAAVDIGNFASARNSRVILSGSSMERQMITMTDGSVIPDSGVSHPKFGTLVAHGKSTVIPASRNVADNWDLMSKFHVTHIIDVSGRHRWHQESNTMGLCSSSYIGGSKPPHYWR